MEWIRRATDDLCPSCRGFPHTTSHIVFYPSHPTSLTERDPWDQPCSAADSSPLFLSATLLSALTVPPNPRTSSFSCSLIPPRPSLSDELGANKKNKIEELLSDGYSFVLTARFQSDSLEKRYGQYRQMSDGGFLVSAKDVATSDNILKIKSMVKEGFHIDESLKNNESNSDDYEDPLKVVA